MTKAKKRLTVLDQVVDARPSRHRKALKWVSDIVFEARNCNSGVWQGVFLEWAACQGEWMDR